MEALSLVGFGIGNVPLAFYRKRAAFAERRLFENLCGGAACDARGSLSVRMLQADAPTLLESYSMSA